MRYILKQYTLRKVGQGNRRASNLRDYQIKEVNHTGKVGDRGLMKGERKINSSFFFFWGVEDEPRDLLTPCK